MGFIKPHALHRAESEVITITPYTIIKTVSTLEEAQVHCNDPKTHKKDTNGDVIWFDGYTEA